MKNRRHRPFLKWAGNKYRCLNEILLRLPTGPCLIEPFAGSSAVFLNTHYPKNIISDQNQDLIHLYQHLQQEGPDFINHCRQWFRPEYNQAEAFYQLRHQFNQSQNNYERSGLFLYLNRHAFNGLCRFNRKGEFNVPFGRYTKPYFPEQELLFFWEKTKNCKIIQADYQTTFKKAKANDIVYCDPPYLPISKTAYFTAYTKNIFDLEQQKTLAKLAYQSAQKGIHVLISNHDTVYARQLYQDANQIYSFPVQRNISAKGNQRQKVQELLVYYAPK
jgi:DNA adenine methylase